MKARENPFTTDRVLKVRYLLPNGLTWESLLERLARLDYRAALVGPDGSGKTTLLEDLAGPLRARGFRITPLRLNRTTNRFPRGYLTQTLRDLDEQDIILFDGADHLGRIAWLRLRRRARKAGGLVVTSHRPGLLPTLVECRPSLEILDAILLALLGGQAGALRATARELYGKHAGNIRDVLRALYDLYAERER